jgi:phosphate transport system protein
MSQHIVKSFDADFAELDRLTADMGSLALKMVADSFRALEQRDQALGERTIANDRAVDQLERQILDRAIVLIARRQPMAVDLRHVMTVLKIAGDLERIGDLAKNTAKRAVALSTESWPRTLVGGLGRMSEQAHTQLEDVLAAFAARDDAKALAVWRSDVRLDEIYDSVFRELLTYMMEDPRNIGLCTHLLFGAKNLERIGDHTTNIAENIHFLVTGEMLGDDRPKSAGASSTLVTKPGA